MSQKKLQIIDFMIKLGAIILIVLLIIIAMQLWKSQAYGIHEHIKQK